MKKGKEEDNKESRGWQIIDIGFVARYFFAVILVFVINGLSNRTNERRGTWELSLGFWSSLPWCSRLYI